MVALSTTASSWRAPLLLKLEAPLKWANWIHVKIPHHSMISATAGICDNRLVAVWFPLRTRGCATFDWQVSNGK